MNESLTARILSGRLLILDGGLSTALEKKGYLLHSKLWTAELLLSDPAAIEQVHLDWLRAGAQIITTASYQATIAGFENRGLSTEEARNALITSTKLALKARRRFLSQNPLANRPLIAASIGPYGAYLADGSEYTGDYHVTAKELEAFHGERIELLSQSGADLLACETVPNRMEAGVLCALLKKTSTPAWVSFCCRNHEQISDGTPLADVAALFAKHPNVVAVGVNCTAPAYISDLIGVLRQNVPSKAVVVYPNSGECYDVTSHAWTAPNTDHDEIGDWVSLAEGWRHLGASIIGGCCRTTPEDIHRLARLLRSCAQAN